MGSTLTRIVHEVVKLASCDGGDVGLAFLDTLWARNLKIESVDPNTAEVFERGL